MDADFTEEDALLQNLWSVVGVATSGVLAVLTPWVWRRVGPIWGIRYVAVAALPAGLALSGLLTLVGRVSRSIGSFFAHLAFSPSVWVGFGLIGLAVLLFLVSRSDRVHRLAGSRTPATAGAADKRPQVAARKPAATGAAGAAGGGDEFSDIEEILRRRGIS